MTLVFFPQPILVDAFYETTVTVHGFFRFANQVCKTLPNEIVRWQHLKLSSQRMIFLDWPVLHIRVAPFGLSTCGSTQLTPVWHLRCVTAN